jgi:cell wall-associated NlpC family hydrolase
MREIPFWVANYVGLPWRVLGRDRTGLDCYGLVRLVLAERCGLALPLLDGGGWHGHREPVVIDALASFISTELHQGWNPVDFADGRCGDLALLLMHGRPIHLGLMVAPGRMLHIQEGHDSGLARLDSLPWRSRLVGIYRHEAMPLPAEGAAPC